MVHRQKQKATACLSNTEKLLRSQTQQLIIIIWDFFFFEKSKKKKERKRNIVAYYKDRSQFSFKLKLAIAF